MKIRAWDIINKRMIYNSYPHDIFPEEQITAVLYFDGNVGLLSAEDGRKSGLWAHEIRGIELIPMLYIGVKDKKGKEIFEGDVCEVECECGYKDLMPVVFGLGRFYLEQTFQHNFPSGELEFNRPERLEVKGNIYENLRNTWAGICW